MSEETEHFEILAEELFKEFRKQYLSTPDDFWAISDAQRNAWVCVAKLSHSLTVQHIAKILKDLANDR